jgi:large subunit ribosomal protein L4
MTHGSRIKMRPQKGQGTARMGDKRAPHLMKGGKAHGSKAVIYSFHLNAKIKINALKALLSAKLAEGKIKIIESEALAEGKTKLVGKAFDAHIQDERGLLCVITGQDCDSSFELAQKNHPRVIWHDTYSLDVFSLFKADKILITQKGLEELIENIYKTIYVVYRQPYMPKVDEKTEKPQEKVKIDPSQPYEFKFKILGEYMELYKKLKAEQPGLLELERARVRKI